jgi:indolepyruvate ferredoxin oxidoreductase, alpha subunit
VLYCDIAQEVAGTMKSKIDEKGQRVLLLGNEAIARGAIEAGIKVASGYPGTPSSEILEMLAESASELGFHAEWSTNEKVAFEVAVGASITGVRSIVSMKNAGLNLIMDPLMTIVYGGIRGGMVIAVADDPGAHYSSNEQDTRIAAAYAQIPCLEPADQQEAKDMTKYGFELSEKLELPVFLRSVTRISHASGDVRLGELNYEEREPTFYRHYREPYKWNVYGPPGPVAKHLWLKSRQPMIEEEIKDVLWNTLDLPALAKIGVIASGLASSYVREVFKFLRLKDKIAFLKIGVPYPLDNKKVLRLLENVEMVLVIEEGEPMVENRIKHIAQENAINIKVEGKTTGLIEAVGEINCEICLRAISKMLNVRLPKAVISEESKQEIEEFLAPRSSTLCPGCPHLGTFWGIKMALRKTRAKVQIINGDIGCYEMGGYGVFAKKIEVEKVEQSKRYLIRSPYETLDTNYVMGSGIGLMQGQSQAGYNDGPLIAVAGDSTFLHSCLPEVVNAVHNHASGVFIVMDNQWTAMTGQQPNPVTGETATGETAKRVSIEEIASALGVEHIFTTDPYNINGTIKTIKEALEQEGFSIVIARRTCTIQAMRRKEFHNVMTEVNPDKCISCGLCVEFGCPAITYENRIGGIDRNLCVDCEMCAQVCPTEALSMRFEKDVKE